MGLADGLRAPRKTSGALKVVAPDDSPFDQGASIALERRADPLVMLEESLAGAALAMEDFRAVVRHCSQIVQACPDHFEAWFNLGFARQQIGELEEAIFAYHQASRIQPADARPWVNLGMARLQVEDEDGAREAFQTAVRLDPDQTQALWNLALIHKANGLPAESEKLFRRLTKTTPDWVEAWFEAGMCRLRRQDWQGAAEDFERCLTLRPHWEPALVELSGASLPAGDHEEVKTLLMSAWEENPSNVTILHLLASAAVESGDLPLGLLLRKKLGELKQPSAELTFNLASVCGERGRIDDAIRLYCEALRENPRLAASLINLGHLLARQGKQTEAAECWRRALALDPALASGYFEPEEKWSQAS